MPKKRGPKPMFGTPMKKCVVLLDEMTLRKLRVIGDKNVSAGVRRSAEIAYNVQQGIKPYGGSASLGAEVEGE